MNIIQILEQPVKLLCIVLTGQFQRLFINIIPDFCVIEFKSIDGALGIYRNNQNLRLQKRL